jgi:choline dehydrogenase
MNQSYDYVIVGAGSAGCVLAARLSEDAGTRVLVLEAGPPDDAPEIPMPAAFAMLLDGPYAWPDRTTPQPGLGGRAVGWPHGRGLGGSSSINGMVYIRGSRFDYDSWRDDHGCDGWGYDDVLPYFRRAEDQQRGASAYHGAGGPLRVEDPRSTHPLSRAWLDAALASGLPYNDDFNGAEQDGVGMLQLTMRGGRRWSAADAYLRPAAARPNLEIETGAMVTRVVIEHGRASGVEYVRDGDRHEARAGEVVLAAGAIKTPQILLLSGVGPVVELEAQGIAPLVDAPGIGRGLHDHPLCLPEWRTPATRNLYEEATPENLALWQREQRGPLSSNGAEAGGFVRTREGLSAPDLQTGAQPGPAPDPGLAMPDRRGVATLVMGIGAKSRGRVSLRSGDPADPPLIDPGYLTEPEDLDILIAGVRLARGIAACHPLSELTAGEHAPGESVQDDEELGAWIRATVMTAFHPTSTCAMGGADEAPCDPELCVREVGGLRVVDASVMPSAPHGNTNAPTMAIAERAADRIRGLTPLAHPGVGSAPGGPRMSIP